ncbi:MAG: TetR/AcrR family transcriptional regulator [Solirubrobacterales bacterium]|nr:TetR/AcrR family transcriptional regulator [Solirubrobacterales bacterium]MBV9167071.1 TetR/AcrR family transcriptional regulator [Solirubrobacterales bacterium]MBV9536838.1 TetR/AcrR family transcriptional regulator [Solirubrobacterales bacterium]
MRSLRLDARRNRIRIVRAARLSFAERGLGIAVHRIADRAGVGIGTLYRHFPSKQSLIDAALADRLDELQPAIDRALQSEDAWAGFAELLLAMVAAQVQDRGFSQMLGVSDGGEVYEQLRGRLLRPFEQLMREAQASGRMRADLAPGDLPVILRMAGAAAQQAGPPQNWRRHVGLLLDGSKPSAQATP